MSFHTPTNRLTRVARTITKTTAITTTTTTNTATVFLSEETTEVRREVLDFFITREVIHINY